MTTNAIEVEDLRKVYPTRQGAAAKALDGVSFQVPQGTIYGLLGPNGAGKSTTVKILGTLTAPTSGRATVFGYDVARQPLEVRRRIAVVLQQTAAESLLTVQDNLLIYAYLHGVPRREAERRLASVAEEFELGPRLKDVVQELSLGTKRRIQVAKIFMLDTPLIILDEATTGMDPMMKRRVMDRLRAQVRNGRTILLTTQVLSEAEELCEKILILDRGHTMASGTLQELRRCSLNMFRVMLTFTPGFNGSAQVHEHLRLLNPSELQINGHTAEMVVHGEEASLLTRLAEVSRIAPILQFEVRAPTLEEIFVNLVNERT
ncbi:MAG TPA: ABC transporter ATP-binding protein, partial [Steroidobacteraceae bacterium]